MKQLFRFFRGEFNGFYLFRALTCLNSAAKELLDELAYHATAQWKLESEITVGETPLREEDLYNVGKIAGLYQDNLLGRTSLGSVGFTPSYMANGQQRSERALMDMQTGTHRFVRTEQDDYPDDIVNDASPAMRAGFVPEGAEPVGYLPWGSELYNEDGSVIWENLLPDPPGDGSLYTPFYGETFLAHEEWFVKDSPLSPEMFKQILECMLRIRRNGPTLGSFFDSARILVSGVVRDIELVLQPGRYFTMYYSVDPDSEIEDQDRLVSAWLWIIQDKFKLFVPELRAFGA